MVSSFKFSGRSGLVVALMLLATLPAWAQNMNMDSASLMGRLDRIERRLQKLETQGVGGAGGSASGDVELRMQDLERESSQNNGTVERLGNSVQQLAKKLDALTKDIDLRLQDIENHPAAAAPTAAQPVAPEAAVPAVPAADKTAVKADAIPSNLTAADHYNKAYAYLTAADYTNAQAWFTAFLKKYPKDKLADNAYYWLGEVYLVENNPTEAVKAFKGGLQNFPQGAKAPANLLKLGLALQQLKQPQYARAAWEKLQKDFPRSVEATKAKDYLLTLPAAEKTAEKPAKKA